MKRAASAGARASCCTRGRDRFRFHDDLAAHRLDEARNVRLLARLDATTRRHAGPRASSDLSPVDSPGVSDVSPLEGPGEGARRVGR